MTIAGVILCGGLSSRMGRPKEGVLLPDGRTMIEVVADAMRPLTRCLLLVGDCRGFDPSRLEAQLLADSRLGFGPMGGIEAALHSGAADHYLICACDQVGVTRAILELLMPMEDQPCALREIDGEELTPFPCLIPATWNARCSDAITAGTNSPRRWLAQGPVSWRSAPPGTSELVRGLNTPEELAEWIRRTSPRQSGPAAG